jgi:hypothetical protein
MEMTRKYRITIIEDEEFENRFRLSLLPFRHRKAPTVGKLAFVSKRLFNSEYAATKQARSTFGIIFVFKRNRAGQLESSFNLNAADL